MAVTIRGESIFNEINSHDKTREVKRSAINISDYLLLLSKIIEFKILSLYRYEFGLWVPAINKGKS